MASTFSDLGIELMATGENAGTWGDKTNTNLQIVEKSIAGYVEQAVTSGGTTALTITDGDATESTSVARHAVIKLTGTITGNSIVTVPDSIEKVYIVTNGTSGAYTVQFKTASGTGITFGVSEKTTKLVYSDGTNLVDAGFGGALDIEGRELVLDADGDTTITADTDDQIDIKIAGADDFQFTANTFTAQSGSTIAAQALTATTVTASSTVQGTTITATTAFVPDASDGAALGTSSLEFSDLFLADAAVINLGADQDVTLTHVADTGVLLNGANVIQFRDSGLTIGSNADGDLDIVSDGTAVDSINIESGGGITLDAGTAGSGIIYEDDGTEMARMHNSSSDVILETKVSDKDFLIKGNDGGSTITALTLDMSAAGKATFNSDVVVGGDLTVSGDDIVMATNTAGNLLIADGTNFNSIAVGSLSEISTVANDDVFLAVDTSGGGLKKIARSAIVSGLATSGAISNVVEDTTPQLGGNLDMNGADIVTTSNADLELAPNGTGHVTVRGNTNQGTIQFNCENNSHGQQVKAAPHSESASNVLTLPSTGGDARLVSASSTATLTNKTLTAPKIADGGFIADANGNELVVFQTTGSAVNEIEITNNATGSNPIIAATGGDTNIGIALTPKGTGEIVIGAGNLNYAGTAITSTGAELNILDGVTSTAAELNVLDGITAVVGELNALDIGSTAVGTAVASKAVILDSNKDYTGIRNFTISGEIDAATGDFSGAVDVAGATTTAAITASGIIKTDDTTEATSTTDGSLQTDGGLSVAKDGIFGDDVTLLSDAAVLKFGADAEVTLTHVHNDGLLLNSDNQLQFRDSAINIRSDADGDLDINADDELELNSTLIDVNGNLDVSGTLTQAGVATFSVAANVAQVALSSSSNAVAWDASAAANAFHVTTENTTFSAPSNNVEGAFIAIEINYNGSHTIAFNTIFEFAGSTAPTFTSTDGKTDILVFRYNGSVWQEVGRTLNLSES